MSAEIIKLLLPLAYLITLALFIGYILTVAVRKGNHTEKKYYHDLHKIEEELFNKALEAIKLNNNK